MQVATDLRQDQAHRQAVRRIELALGVITTGLDHRDRQIRTAILTELAGTPAHTELLKKPVELLNRIASTISTLGGRIRDGFAYDSLLELQTEARAIFARCERERG